MVLPLALLLLACGRPDAPAPAEPAEPAEAPAEVSVDVREWPVPWEKTRPRDPDVAPDGTVWFVGQTGDYLATLDPETGAFDKVDLPEGTGPHNLVVADDGRVWYAGNLTGHVGIYDPKAKTFERIDMPEGVNDPHTLVFAPSGDLWFTAQRSNFVGRISDGEVTALPVPTPGALPYGIVVDPSGRPWFNLFGTNKLGTVDDGEVREIDLPRPDARSRRIALTADGAVWYVDYAGGRLGRYEPGAGTFEEWELPGGAGSRPYAMAVDDEGRLWAVETGSTPNRLVGFDPETEAWVATVPIPSGGGAVRHMVFHDGALWFGTDTNTVGRARI